MTIIYVENSSLLIHSEDSLKNKIFNSTGTILPNILTNEILSPFGFSIVTIPEKPQIAQYENAILSEPKIVKNKVVVNWVIDSKIFNEQLKSDYIEKLRHVFEPYLLNIKSTYPESEVDGWDLQKDEAKNFLNDPDYPTPCLDALSAFRGIDKTLLAQKVIEKAIQFATVYGTIIGTRQKLEDQILAATSYEELPVIENHYVF